MPLDDQPSASAFNVALCRAIAAFEPREEIKGPDHLAEIFLPEVSRQSLRNLAIRPVVMQKVNAFSPGAYEFFMARTAYMDGVVERALRENVPQIVFLGAGYDTRTYRFCHLIRDTRIFEVDTLATQEAKRAALEQAQVAIPDQLSFLAVDFTRDDLLARLTSAGFAEGLRTLYVWEGVTYYLPPDTVDAMFAFMRAHAPAGSLVCFDYMFAASELEGRFGAQQARDAMLATYGSEPLYFDLAPDQLEAFLAARGYAVVEHLTAPDMQRRYLTLRDGSPAGEALDLFGMVLAEAVS
ncbi:class I SAM-dependent methyltransferase [Aggregatilinea lenta]|uniref:class I SAM-dependent methyltransferase n=1 Tax=Aggregatilinea lenta TaxID=913108 RepID=UPI000E5A47C0|nr:SAM-dependent methyltransferase [Aggregatilinea lenta]